MSCSGLIRVKVCPDYIFLYTYQSLPSLPGLPLDSIQGSTFYPCPRSCTSQTWSLHRYRTIVPLSLFRNIHKLSFSPFASYRCYFYVVFSYSLLPFSPMMCRGGLRLINPLIYWPFRGVGLTSGPIPPLLYPYHTAYKLSPLPMLLIPQIGLSFSFLPFSLGVVSRMVKRL